MVVIDPARLPLRPLLDSGVFLRWLGERPGDPQTPLCRELVQTLIDEGRDILVAAPTISEVLRGWTGDEPPSTAEMRVVAFDNRAAHMLAARLPLAVALEHRRASGEVGAVIKYDAMIIACAIRWEASCVISLDAGFRTLAGRAMLAAHHPSEFEQAQQELFDEDDLADATAGR